MDFSEALVCAKTGKNICRDGWNGSGMFVFLSDAGGYYLGGPYASPIEYPLQPFLAMKTADNNVIPWLASQTDILACDWMVHNE